MNIEEIEEIKRKYKLSEEEHKIIGEQIKNIMLFDKYPVQNPRTIINIAPPASGKTGLNGFASTQFEDNNVIIINGDELKPYHPKTNEIAKLYPEYYAMITEQESNIWTADLFDKALKEGYNLIFEGTGRNERILETIKSKMKRYNVTVRGMAVNELNCLISILERYEYQVETRGWGRLLTVDYFYDTYKNMPNTIDKIEKSGIVNDIEVYKRGNEPMQPIKIYDSREKEMGRFPSSKYAVLGGRIEDEKDANKQFEEKINTLKIIMRGKTVNEAEKNILMKIIEINEIYKKKISKGDIKRDE